MPFVLNTSGFWDSAIKGKARHVPRDQNAGIPEELLSRFCEGFEPRADVVAGQLVSGSALRQIHKHSAVPCSLPAAYKVTAAS